MSDQLEDFIRNNRKDFDIDDPSPMVWDSINKELHGRPKRRLFSIIGIAASALILVTAGYFMGSQNNQEIESTLFANEEQYQEFKEAEVYYTNTISSKMTEVEDLGVESDVLNDLMQLDEVYQELKEEMLAAEYKDKEVLVNLLIKNYQTKIAILEKIIGKTKNATQSKNFNNETINI